ncbi:MAG: hypothetical protein ACHQQQ_01855 [Bacteroidota bacterium]
MPKLPAIILIFFFSLSTASSQETPGARANDLRKYFIFDNPHPLACLFTYFPSIFIQHEIELKSFVRSKTFSHLREQFGDQKAVDAIYIRAMQLTNNNTAISLLLATLATFDHRVVELKIPIFEFGLPLSEESGGEFSRRVKNLPRTLYDDSPDSGDRDKLQHFFGSAFITYISESRDAADRFGMFVEKGERLFIIGGVYDERDLRADWQGQNFGSALLKNNRKRPSHFLTNYPAGYKTENIPSGGVGHDEELSETGASCYITEGP